MATKLQVVPSGHFGRLIHPFATFCSGRICLQCRNQAPRSILRPRVPVSTPPSNRRYANTGGYSDPGADPNSLSERLRRKIWKQDEPEDLADPYGDRDIVDRDQKQYRNTVEAQETAVAPKASQEPALPDNYIPASTWDGLERIGGATGWWEDAWDQEHQFEGFMSLSKLETRESISFAIYQSLIEIHTLKKAKKSCTISDQSLDQYYVLNSGKVDFLRREDGMMDLHFVDETSHQEILDHIINNRLIPDFSQVDNSEEDTNVTLAESTSDLEEESQAKDLERPMDEMSDDSVSQTADTNFLNFEIDTQEFFENNTEWLLMPFGDLRMKFAIFKRVMQLTGVRVPDPEIDNIHSAKALLGYIMEKPKPKKLADRLILNESLSSLPNVQIMDCRYTPIHREKEVGRWKEIEKELVRRDLPVTGNV